MDGGTLGATLYVFGAAFSAIAGALLGGPGARSRIRWGVTGLILPFIVFFLLHRRLRHGNVEFEQGRPRVPPRPVPHVGGADISTLPEPVTACPDCGFLGIRSPGIQDGVWPGGGELVAVLCPRCDYRGLPLLFPRREDYAEYVDGLQHGPHVTGESDARPA